jgi:DNA polymerase III delta prime subunit
MISVMTTPSRQQLREWSAELTLGPLNPADPDETRYVPLADAGRAAVDELLATIELAIDTTTQLLSGPSGSGKTTELYRLRGELRQADYHAEIFDVGTYVTEFLIALALGAHDVLGAPGAGNGPGFVGRLRRLLDRLKISVDVPGLSATVSRENLEIEALGGSVEVELQRELKSSEAVVTELRSKLTYHIGRLYEEVAAFLTTLLPVEDPGQGSVLIVDGLEKLRGTSENDLAVQESVQALFVAHAGKLKFHSHHLIYTVPTYLQFTSPGALPFDSRVLPVPVPHVRPRPGQSVDTVAKTIAELQEVVSRRLPIDLIFGDKQLDAIIQASGGHLRDLFTLLRQVLNLMLRRSLTPPLDDEHVEEAIGLVAHDFMKMTAEQKAFLRQVASGDGTVDPAESEVQLMARLLQSHMLLSHLNGQDWYEVHPLARRALGMP